MMARMLFNANIIFHPLILATILSLISAHSTYSSNKTCGEITCNLYQYCSIQELLCRPCERICEKETHNYDEAKCQNDCADYIHDVQIGYASRKDVQSVIDEVNKIYVLLVVILILVIILLTLVGGMFVKVLYRYRKEIKMRQLEQKKFQQKLSSVQYTISNNNNTAPKRDETIDTITQSMRTNMSTMTLTTQTESPPSTNKSTNTTKTLPLSVEEPCEDTTLDYAAYVNQALSHSPPNEVHLCPTRLDMS